MRHRHIISERTRFIARHKNDIIKHVSAAYGQAVDEPEHPDSSFILTKHPFQDWIVRPEGIAADGTKITKINARYAIALFEKEAIKGLVEAMAAGQRSAVWEEINKLKKNYEKTLQGHCVTATFLAGRFYNLVKHAADDYLTQHHFKSEVEAVAR